jgi:RsiW-degrading membrane proteinase PrsW (M82 family)
MSGEEVIADAHDDPLEELAAAGRWGELWWAIPQHFYYGYEQTGAVLLGVLTGCCWLAFLLKAMQLDGWLDWRLPTAFAAIALGVLSIWPTGFFIYWQEYGWGLVDSPELVPGLRANILGVGLREELAKLLCLLPLMPVLVRKANPLAALIVSGCVGLGFAVEENISYFSRSLGADAVGRLLIANPIHFSLTGLVGLSVYRACLNPRGWATAAVTAFGLAVVAHGVYDASISVLTLAEVGLISTIVFALIMYQFFRELRGFHTPRGEVVSLSATFLAGVSLIAAATFVELSATVGCRMAFHTMATDVLGLAVMVYLFLREMPETMIRV